MSTEHTTDEIGPDVGDDDRGDVSIEEISAELESLRAEIDALREENKQLRQEIETVRANECDCSDRIEWRGDSQKIESLWISGVPIGSAIAKRKEEIEELREQLNEEDSSLQTELEVALQAPPDVVTERYGIAEQRAITIAHHLREIGGPNGVKVDKRLLRILDRECEESIAWAQLYRACEALQSLSNGRITFVDNDGDVNKIRIDDESVLS